MRRGRFPLVLCLVVTVGLGLLSRRFPLPGVFAEHTGDALYTVAAFWAIAALAPAAPGWQVGMLAFSASVVVECSQLLDWTWLATLRANRVGALLLGQGFQFADLVAYALGAAVAWGVDRLTFPRRSGRDALGA
ncbi:MAG: DUF2809 domain-containing protein [Planctomycetes bacterium]|nr:DUF2809 domain-containing protein [Planctomycetota bacterium]